MSFSAKATPLLSPQNKGYQTYHILTCLVSPLETISSVSTLLLQNARKLRSSVLSKLEDIAGRDPQVALTLICICGGFCHFNHLARAIPTPLAFDALQMFDAAVRQCFLNCGNLHNGCFMVSSTAPSTFRSFGTSLPLPSCQYSIHCILFFIRML